MGSFVPSKKTTPQAPAKVAPKPPAKVAPVKAAPAPVEEAEQEGTETQEAEGTETPAKEKLPAGAKLSVKIRKALKLLDRVAVTLERIAAKDDGEAGLASGFRSLVTDAEEAAKTLDAKPEGWGAKVRVPRKPLEVAIGSFVAVKEAARAELADLVDVADLARIKVVGITPKMLACVTGKGERIFVPRTSVVNVEA